MPRQPRLDIPGLVHHVMARGIEGREIFRHEKDRETFLEGLAQLVGPSQWARPPDEMPRTAANR